MLAELFKRLIRISGFLPSALLVGLIVLAPGLAGRAPEALKEVLVCGDHRFEVLLPEVGPLVVVNSLVDGPLLHVGRALRFEL